MKKILGIFLVALFLAGAGAVYAEDEEILLIAPAGTVEETTEETAEETQNLENANTVDITLSIKEGYCHSIDAKVILKLSDEKREYTKEEDIGNDAPTQNISFLVDEYKIDSGKTFNLEILSGVDKLFFNEEAYLEGQAICVTPLYNVFEGEPAQEEIKVEYIPSRHNAVNIVFNAKMLEFPVTARNIGEHVIVPLKGMADALEVLYTEENGVYKLSSAFSTLSVEGEEIYIEKPDTAKIKQEVGVAPQYISGELFVPISAVADAFNLSLIMEQTEGKPTIYVATGAIENVYIPNNEYVNSKALSSTTDYLVWVSKSEYKVRVYLGSNGNWNQIKEFTCAIGAPRTPTCEGTYKYYQAQTMWDYGSYYVGPIMRFNGGYAIHSTLIYKNGTPKDNRVGMKLSLGCVRLRPDDINWMAYYIPLYTTIHITG